MGQQQSASCAGSTGEGEEGGELRGSSGRVRRVRGALEKVRKEAHRQGAATECVVWGEHWGR